MSEFLADPSVLTKEKLKSELIANNVSLPGGEQRKDVYVQLYLQHLTARNPPAAAQPDFSSDEERELTPLGARNRGAAVGRKATKKTDKPRPEEKDDLDVTEMSNEDLQEQLVKYGLNPGPIVATTRKLYEKKLLKLMEQGPELKAPVPFPEISSAPENTRQNGSNDSDQYSDNEEEPKTELRLEKREPLKARTKTPVALKQRRVVEHNQVDATAQLPVDDAVISESTPIAETILTASNETLVVNRVPGNFKHAAPTLSISELSEMPRRTPKKPLMTAEVLERTHTEEGRVERDILKEMFPYEVSTPTGISASCRRPIKGAASRPIEHSDFRMEESFSKYAPKYGTSTDIKSEKPPTKKERSIPLWIKVLLFVVISVFLVLVYQSMETNQGNPFSKYLNMVSRGGAK
ncbi:thymopoietin isoform X6 [Falco biarmicus]|uniref:thymopoietin isoform X6 n=1 Tax=Falco cherrug TaxID=345164 RepID=UPI00247A44C0|nr:thymopoietin isoform X6 [Falco cherrug]XP_055663955.1 thymopoietin isoform X6 [Falco peregrinus]XP_056196206.1 thymopoietin isoform X6 [Falco biarmicus]